MSTWNKHYHWKTKGCTPWAKNHITEATVGKQVTVGKSGHVKVDRLSSFEGDVELGNRKGKLITIYDCAIAYAWSGSSDDGTEASGTITFPEVSHEIEDEGDEYRFETEMSTKSSAETNQLYDAVRKELAPSLRPVFHAFRQTLIDAHAKDLGHDSPASTPGAATPTTTSTSTSTTPAAAAPASATGAAPKPSKGSVSTSSSDVRVSSELAISISDLWDLLTNPSRIPMWTRAPAQFEAKADADFALFGGNVTGKVISVDAPKQLIQKWRTPQFPQGHYGTLAVNLTEGGDSTKLELVLSGAPSGDEEVVEKNLETYYIRGLKSMGLGTIL
ncbi:Activator of Hsp90 ATPase, N-terminal [Kalmanozyma brasiliensis GHG001]|uniref:Activator of Hsp90 ATPase, N-terminal n=1 Tax=Kalmanozyma brasiliensis (strain GHG001) TaxID=1365824 RepID=UPI002867D516|nr:Activator of Hsp90 ATPase, N-terminal [Kalmanozyma brasiliensis GHG001]KAF6766994.1 Activator of Hsp90 ATPase, N-terminal [Kalmanozyma brasiliensis GHG001]